MKKTTCVDLDGTLAKYDTWKGLDVIGDPIEGAQDFVRDLLKYRKVLIYTTRMNVDSHKHSKEVLKNKILAWLKKNGFPKVEVYSGDGKPLCAEFIDDKALRCTPQENPNAYKDVLEEIESSLNIELEEDSREIKAVRDPVKEVRDNSYKFGWGTRDTVQYFIENEKPKRSELKKLEETFPEASDLIEYDIKEDSDTKNTIPIRLRNFS